MPRATRSKKIVIAEDDTDIATQIPLPDSPGKAPRFVLQEISHNPEPETITVEDAELALQLKGLKAAYKTAIGGKKNKKGRGKKKDKEPLALAVVEDDELAVVSPAIQGARQILSSDEEDLPSARRERAASPPSPAVRATRQQLAKTRSVERFDHSGKVSKDNDMTKVVSPVRAGNISTAAGRETQHQVENVAITPDCTEDDSFVEQITTRSPAKPVSRIEDSVEALDKLEEVIEALDEATITKPSTEAMLTALGEKRAAKITTQPFASMRVKSKDSKHNAKPATGNDIKAGNGVKKVKSSSALRESVAVSEGRVVLTKKPVKRPSSLLPPKQPMKSVKPLTQSNFELPGEVVARRLKEQREARQAQREANEKTTTTIAPALAPKVKSTKPPTMPVFELPGEAVSRKKREALEARLKLQEEEGKRRKEFKAKPLRKSTVPDFVPRETAASRARKGQAGSPDSENAAMHQRNSSLTVAKRSSVVGAHRPSIQATTLANKSAPRSPGEAKPSQLLHARKASTGGPAISGLTVQRTVSAAEVQLQRQRAKEIYNRDSKTVEEVEKEKKEREAAAKRARLEAAERGRQASREWAEKQRAKKALQSDKGPALSSGVGGQSGLKA